MKYLCALFVLSALVFISVAALTSGEQRPEAAPSCYIGHLATMESKPLPSGQIALHFSGWMEGGEKHITQFERSVPVWPAQEPHVLMCVQFSPSDSAQIPQLNPFSAISAQIPPN